MDSNTENIENNTQNTENTQNTSSNATIPTSAKDYFKVIGPPVAQFYGRKVLYDDFLPEDVNNEDTSENAKKIGEILTHIWSSHNENANEIDYLEKYYRGYQPILGKSKDIRPTINNIVLSIFTIPSISNTIECFIHFIFFKLIKDSLFFFICEI